MASLTADLANAADDAALRRLLRENPIPGRIAVTFEREPCYFGAAALEGPLHQTFVMRAGPGGPLVGMANRSVRSRYVNGQPRPIGYISQLRASPDYGWGLGLARAVAKGFDFLHQLHADGQTPYYLCSIMAENAPAQRLLAAGLAGMPTYHAYGRLHTYAVNVGRHKPDLALPRGLTLRRGTAALVEPLLDCLQRNGPRRQFTPEWTRDNLFRPESTPNLRPEDFWLALHGERVTGCLAAWDQSAFKQTVVRSYAGVLSRWRPLLNTGARLGAWPVLPPVNCPFRYCYASHLALDDDDPRVFAALLRAVYNHASQRGDHYFMLGLSEADPLTRVVVAGYRPITYTAQLYLVAWEDGREAVAQVDARVPGLEIAVL